MTHEQKQAYDWAKAHSYNSVSARYAKLLAWAVDDLLARAVAAESALEREKSTGRHDQKEKRGGRVLTPSLSFALFRP